MNRDAQKTLFYPFEAGVIDAPAKGERVLFIGAEPGMVLPRDFDTSLTLVQGFRPYFRTLSAAGHAVIPRPEGHDFHGALVLAGRHRRQNEMWIAEAAERVVPGRLIVVAGSAEDGIASLRKRLGKIVGLDGHMPKYHGVVFWFRRPDDAAPLVDAMRQEPASIEGRFAAAPGMFSHDRIDAGSRLLADSLPDSCKGAAADFGAGWGYLSVILAERTKGLKAIDLYEADFVSLEAAKMNLATISSTLAKGFFWHDLVGEKVERKYDLIVMNPPFHQGRAAEPEIGQEMIKAAASALKSGGRLFMVQNRGLPYDQTLKAGFSDVAEIRRDGGFRIIVARR